MATGAIYHPPAAFPASQYPTTYPQDDRHPDYPFYPSPQPPPQYTQRQQIYQAWAPPPHYSVDSYQNTPYVQAPSLPPIVTSPPLLRHPSGDDPAFAPDPNANPDHWFRGMDVLSTAPFPRPYSSPEFPQGFVPQSGPVPYPPHRSRSYNGDTAISSPVTQPFYLVNSSPASSTSSNDSAMSDSSASRLPHSSARTLDYPRQYSDPSFHYIPATEAPEKFSDQGQFRHSNAKHRPKRRSTHAAPVTNVQTEISGAVTVIPTAQQPTAPEDRSSQTSQMVMSSMTVPPPPGLSERPKEGRRRTSSRPTPRDLDSIDELDETNPLGFNLHHKGPYEDIAAALNETNPIDSPLLRVKGIQQQVSAKAAISPSRRIQSVPLANPMSLNLRPGEILQHSIYQPRAPTHFPPDLSLATNRQDRHMPPPRMPAELPTVDYGTSTPLRRNQTLPVASLARGPVEQPHHIPPSVRPEVHGYQQPSYPGSSTHLVETQVAKPPEVPPTPGLDERFSRTLYLTNPDERSHNPGHRLHAPPLPPASENVSSSRRVRAEQSSQNHLVGVPATQPQVVAPNATTQTEVHRRRSPRNSLPVASIDHRQEAPRRYDPPSQTLAAMNLQHVGVAASTSSSRSSSTLTPRHLPKHLVMPTPLANTIDSSPPMRRPQGSGSSTVSSPPNGGRPPQLLRKRSVPAVMSRSQRAQDSTPSETVNRGILAFFGFGKGSKPTVREFRVTEPTKRGMSEKQEFPVREETRKLTKRK